MEPFVFETKLGGQVIDSAAGLTFDQRIQMGVEEVGTILRKIWPYLLVGIGLGAVIHGWVPTDFFTTYAGPGNAFGVLVAVGIGIPLYSNAAGIMPLVQALYEKGLPMGTLLAFMMSVVALSPARDDPAAPRAQAPAARRVRRRRRPRASSPSATCSTPCSPDLHSKENTHDHQGARPRLRQLQEPRTRHPGGRRRPRPRRDDREGHGLRGHRRLRRHGTPALVIDEKVVVSGRVPTETEVRGLLAPASAQSKATDVGGPSAAQWRQCAHATSPRRPPWWVRRTPRSTRCAS